jgi:hypothetical protein
MPKTAPEELLKLATNILEFYADPATWKEKTAWTSNGSPFGDEPDDRQPYSYFPVLEDDKGENARRILKLIKQRL